MRKLGEDKMSWEDIIKQDEKEQMREALRKLGNTEIKDALSILEDMVEKNQRYKGDFLLKKIKKYLEDYLDRFEEFR